jgi:molybdopterin converting factor small subunit
LRIRLYGRLADAIAPEVHLAAAGCSVGEVRELLAAEHAAVARSLEASRAVIADSFVGEERIVGESEKLEFLPPVSGG